MARMLGRKVWDRIPCSCCNPPRTVGVERARERREVEREIRDEVEQPRA